MNCQNTDEKIKEPNCQGHLLNRRFGLKFRNGVLLAFLLFSVAFLFPSLSFAQVVINEFQISPSSNQWIELYNKGDQDFDISGWIIDDKAGGSSKQFVVPTGTVLASKKCLSFESGNFDWNTSSPDSVRLISSSSAVIEEYLYKSSPGNNISIGRVVDGEGDLAILTVQSQNKYNLTGELCLASTPTPKPTATLTPTPTSTPTPTTVPTQTAAPAKATVQINQPKDGNDNKLIGVLKIYLDGNYTGNYAPETYTFCDNCQCGTNKISCGFGEHALKVEKTGYESWEKTITVSVGNSYEETPVLVLETVTSTPTSTSVATSTSTLKTSPVVKTPTPSASPEEEGVLASESASEILGAENQLSLTPTPTAKPSAGKSKIISLVFILFGLSFLAVSAYSYFRRRNSADEKESESEENH